MAIDPAETDAHFQLGRIAREQGRLPDALRHFQTVLDQNERHSQYEVLRELGGMYVKVRQYEDAPHMLADYAERVPYDPEGLYYYGQALEELGEMEEAREMYDRAVEATGPHRAIVASSLLDGAGCRIKATQTETLLTERDHWDMFRAEGICIQRL